VLAGAWLPPLEDGVDAGAGADDAGGEYEPPDREPWSLLLPLELLPDDDGRDARPELLGREDERSVPTRVPSRDVLRDPLGALTRAGLLVVLLVEEPDTPDFDR